jgi:4-amino-4-deoxy-L-arabinose transferase-like glycosyltransferase
VSLTTKTDYSVFRNAGLLKALRPFLWLSGISFLVWAFIDPRFRDAEGFMHGGFCLPFSSGMALTILASSITREWRRFAFWFALALAGQAVALQLIKAGSELRYQHYISLGGLLTEVHPLLTLYLVLQTAVVFVGLKGRWQSIRTWLGRTFKAWQLLTIGTIFFFTSATVSRQIPFYVTELILASFIQALNLANIVLMVWALPEKLLASLANRFKGIFEATDRDDASKIGKIDRFAVLAGVWVTVLAAILCLVSYERHPHVPDEVAYLYHARYLANGTLTMPAPPVSEAFDIYLMQVDGEKWYPSLPVGWPAMLAVGMLLGVPWLINPVLAGFNILLAYVFLQEIYSRHTARMSLLLLCFSPWYVFMAMNFMTHTFTLTCSLIAAVSIVRARRTRRATWGWLSGFAVGIVSLIRPLEGLIVALLLGLWSIGVGGERLRTAAIVGLVLGSLISGAAVLPYNKYLTDNPTVFPIMAYTDQRFGPKSNALGFGPERGMGWAIDPYPGHSPRDALINTNLNAFSINIELFGWSIGSVLLLAIFVFSGPFQRSDYLMFAVIAAVFVAHFFYYFSGGPDFGARYWFLMIIPLVVLTVRGMQSLGEKLQFIGLQSIPNNYAVILTVLCLCLLTLVNYFPWRAIDKYHHYRGMRPDIRYLAKKYEFGRSLVLIRGNARPDYASAAFYNPLDLHADSPVYAWDKSQNVRRNLLQAYPDRKVWVIDGPSLTRSGFKVVTGPILTRNSISTEIETK